MACLAELLRTRGVDFTFAPETCVFECQSYARCYAAKFNVYLYEAESAKKPVLIEVQRRSVSALELGA